MRETTRRYSKKCCPPAKLGRQCSWALSGSFTTSPRLSWGGPETKTPGPAGISLIQALSGGCETPASSAPLGRHTDTEVPGACPAPQVPAWDQSQLGSFRACLGDLEPPVGPRGGKKALIRKPRKYTGEVTWEARGPRVAETLPK